MCTSPAAMHTASYINITFMIHLHGEDVYPAKAIAHILSGRATVLAVEKKTILRNKYGGIYL